MSMCDIVIPVWNQLDVTRDCLESIVKNTLYPYRIVIVDNASDDPTREYLENERKRFGGRIEILRNERNLGFIKAVNSGISYSDAEYVCVLNNDTLVTRKWLSELILVMNKDKRIGIVNPSSNNLGQRIPKKIKIEDYVSMLQKHSGEYCRLGSVLGFCMLTRRSLFREIGLFDEIFGMGNFEDTDLSYRAKKKGYMLVRAVGSYVFHKENRSFRLLKSYRKDFEKNKRIFEDRWGRTERLLFVFGDSPGPRDIRVGLIERELNDNNWVFVALKKGPAMNICHSHLTQHVFRGLFPVKIMTKILFKKKKFDRVYCDDKRFMGWVVIFRPFHGASVNLIDK